VTDTMSAAASSDPSIPSASMPGSASLRLDPSGEEAKPIGRPRAAARIWRHSVLRENPPVALWGSRS
jgi:hypothetical protein